MPILSAEHLFEQADKLISPPPAGPPRQVDLRRAISSAYYGLFHFGLTSIADEFVGKKHRTTVSYAVVYRSIGHRGLKDICIETRKHIPGARYAPFFPTGGFGSDITAFAGAAIDLQEKRHTADYDPRARFKTSDAKAAIDTARTAVRRFERAAQAHRRLFLTLLLCPPR